MNRYIAFVLRRPVFILVFLVLATIVLVPGMSRLEFDNSVESFMPKNDREYIYYNEVKEIYGDNGRFVIMTVSDKDLWSYEALKKFDDLITDLEEYKEFNEDRETIRLKQFDSIASKGTVTYSDLIGHFREDPVFQRLLKRKINTIFSEKDVLNRGDLKKLRVGIEYSNSFKRLEVIDTILSPLTAEDITGENDILETYDLIETDENGKRIIPKSEKEIAEFRRKLERNPAFDKGIFSRDPQSGEIADFGTIIKFINLEDQDPVVRELLELIESGRDLEIVATGVAVVNKWMNDYMHDDLFKNVPLVLLVVIIVFYFNFRSVRGIVLPFITLGMAELWILGLMGYLGIKITGVGVSLPPLMIAVGSSYAIHILNQYYAEFDMITEKGKRTGLQSSMSHISLTVLLAGLTTFIAFMTLATSEVSAIREWGMFSAIGVMFAVFISSSLIPAWLSLLPHKMPSILLHKDRTVKKTMVDRIIAATTNGSIIHYKTVLVIVSIIVVVSIIGLLRINVETAFLTYFKESDPIRVNTRVIGDKLGGGWGFNILIDTGEVDGVKKPEFLNMIEDFRVWLEAEDNPDLNIGRTDSFSDFIKTMHMAMNNDDMTFYRIPESRSDIVDYLEIYSGDDDDSDGRFDEFESFVDEDFQTFNLLARLSKKEKNEVSTTKIKHIFSKISDYLDKNLPTQYAFSLTGFPMMDVKLVYYVVKGQMQSLFLSLIVVGIIVILLFNHIKAGPLALIPISTAVIVNFGIMGWSGIKLDMATSVIAALTIGIGVDDTIHFLNTFRHNRARGLSVDETIARTLAVSGKAILFTSLALIFGFSVLLTSHFIPIILFGILTATTMINTTIGALLILPSVIKATDINLTKSERKSRLGKYLDIDRLLGLEQKK
jgi:predicted RND superfamily exporter protein